jgi:exosortase/archaeosortase family protein
VSVKSRSWPVAVLVLAALAYSPLLRESAFAPSRYGFESALFRPAPMPALLTIAIAAWLAWRRRARAAPWGVLGSLALFALAAGASTWAALTHAPYLLCASAAALLLGFAGRAMALPAVVLLLAIALPAPLEAELVWQLQRLATAGAATLVSAFGRESVAGSAMMWIGPHEYWVIDGCSGLRGILILTLVALIVRELFAHAGARAWAAVLLAPLLGHALNVVRIAWVAGSEQPGELADLSGFAGDHTPQGLAVIGIGTAVLYLCDWALARGATPATPVSAIAMPLRWRTIAVALAALAAIALFVPPFGAPPAPPALAFPDAAAGWISEPLVPDPNFVGPLPPGASVHRRYVRSDASGRVRRVELLAVAEHPPPLATHSLFASKLLWPGGGWLVNEHRAAPLPALAREVELSQAIYAPGPERALTYLWRARDRGLLRESLRALLALDATPWRRARPRVVVRLVSPTPRGGPVAYDIAKRTLDVFASDFRAALAAL